jgi:quercetin dioxygenase-like cupin family protein
LRALAFAAFLVAAPAFAVAQVSPPILDEAVPLATNLTLRMVTVDLPPAGSGPLDTKADPGHMHPGATYAYVLSGHVRSRLDKGPEVLFGPGQAWSETPHQAHYIVNASATEPARLLVTFIVPRETKEFTEPLPK